MKRIEIDELSGEPIVVVFQGVEYPVKEPTVADIKKIGSLEASDELDYGLELLRILVPNLDVEALPSRSVVGLCKSLTPAIRGDEDDEKN